MDNTSLSEMGLEQIPKEFQPNKSEHKSPWAIIVILIIVIAFAVFWFVESKKETVASPVVSTQETSTKDVPTGGANDLTSDLEASIGSIDIPDYSSSL